MTDLEKAARMALEKVQEFKSRWWKVPPFGNKLNKAQREAITFAHVPVFELEDALRQALSDSVEQPAQQEPVAWKHPVTADVFSTYAMAKKACCYGQEPIPLYTSPQRKPWVGLTDDDLDDIATAAKIGNLYDLRLAIEAKLKEKNA